MSRTSVSVTVHQHQRSDRWLVVVDDGNQSSILGPAPPELRRLQVPEERLPGVDLDVIWQVDAAPTGLRWWVQSFRDGQEVVADDRARHRIELHVRYVDLVGLCYLGVPFERVLDTETILSMVGPLSCLAGLLQGPSSRRAGLLRPEVAEALMRWIAAEG